MIVIEETGDLIRTAVEVDMEERDLVIVTEVHCVPADQMIEIR